MLAHDLSSTLEAATVTALDDLHALEADAGIYLDEPDSRTLIARLRDEGILTDKEWQEILRRYAEALRSLAEQVDVPACEPDDVVTIQLGERDENWLRIVRARKATGYQLPSWAAMWLWAIAHRRDEPAGLFRQIAVVVAEAELDIPRTDKP